MANQKIAVTVKNIDGSGLLMHRFPESPIKALEKKTQQEQAEYAAYRDPDNEGKLFIPAEAFRQSFINAASFSKGKKGSTLVRITAAVVFVDPQRISLGVDKYDVDARPVIIKATKGRIMRYRPRLDKWQVSFIVSFDDDLLTEDQLRQIIDDAGRLVGILDFNPKHRGSFGRFTVTKWKRMD